MGHRTELAAASAKACFNESSGGLMILESEVPRKTERRLTDSKSIIRNIPFFSDLSADETDNIDRIFIKKRFHKDQIVLSEEDTSSYMYLVYSGKVRVVKLNEEGREQIISFHKRGDFFGEMSLLDGNTSPATIIAHEDAIIGLLHKNEFEHHLLNHEAIRRRILDMLCFRLREAWKMVKLLSFSNAEHRVMAALDRLQVLYGVRDDRGIIINLRVKHQLIANYASISRETATRILNKLAKSGEIVVLANKYILITNGFCDRIRMLMQ
jgi:CRP-like cAMP-binding protein